MTAEQNILLDPSIRDWVLLPLIAIVLFVGVLRHYASLLMNSAPKPNMSKICNTNIQNYGRQLLSAGSQLSPDAFKRRAERMINGVLNKEMEAPNPMEMMNDPNLMMGMMKNQFMMMVPNIGMMMLVSYFFSGFVVAKFPFSLSNRFREMMQRGLDIDVLNCNYVTSLSLYFLIMSGNQGLLQLLLGQDVESGDQTALMQQQMQQAPGQPVDYGKVFKQLTEELNFVKDRHKWAYANAPDTLLKTWRAQKRVKGAAAARRS
ncbi:putative mitochondrial hypothetical protein [Leptomonas pyrrhocoris]|uniref:ER membrane protein complex subunit 3 n=1 Tax=Leptomonas pyrrhocoris TaxID=157538 RepID=A0A0M9G0Q6_LEPPY|nr:putative mitochondrial hypothetical protein [Leptomonas pyrrhocoris]XP_015658303.1 putative mitochondrial hypothetical protein [Leptomonas pyrrhocoris]KPA79863.1 putative mitochondrial hypothetical protein [Leptomonas pyrrhocoris]KPA79864.1 putative mitochondrial hypothetical protein [Leptomonas pyrrhocoris]|eukprot:XP_015658302.1 putative mitochondrial hypothetical protein [Leptomonas pyrrhocoris]